MYDCVDRRVAKDTRSMATIIAAYAARRRDDSG